MNHSDKKPNALIKANSPYLLQHAYNPVQWNEWSSTVLQTALSEQKLLLVSIGYAACHWCHVMEKECFEDEETADIMNAYFINIKVDREERPDIDQVYMDAIQLLTGQGGWPLNAICLPNGKPLYVGTYFPKKNWQQLLLKIQDFYANQPEEAYAYANKLSAGLELMEQFEPEHGTYISNSIVHEQIRLLKEQIDSIHGGFKWVPKFLLPLNWELFLQYGALFQDEKSIEIVKLTCTKIADGGIHDVLGGGFSRYSTDSKWLVPHFEKMLYDNAQLLSLFSKIYSVTNDPKYLRVIHKTIDFLTSDLKSSNCLYYAAIDADSMGEEGLFYTWELAEIKTLLPDKWELACAAFGITEEGNWENQKNVLHRAHSSETLGTMFKLSVEQVEELLTNITDTLYKKRAKRIAPITDTKQICSWNALLIIAFADASKALNSPEYRSACRELMELCIQEFYKDDQLYRIVKHEQKIPGFAEDYAFFCEALLAAAEACQETAYLSISKKIMDQAIANFYVSEEQLFQFTPVNQKELLKIKFEIQDSVMPSSNASFAKCLFYLSYYFEDDFYDSICEDLLLKIIPKIKEQGNNYAKWMQVLLLKTEGFNQIVATGKNALEGIQLYQQKFLPNTICFAVNAPNEIPLFKDKKLTQELSIYICQNKTCGMPIHHFDWIQF